MTDELLEGVKIAYITDYYDYPLSGHAWYQNRYCFFQLEDYDSYVYTLFEVPRLSTIIAISERQLFEDIVGYGWTRFLDHKNPSRDKFVEDASAFWNDPYILNLRVVDGVKFENHPRKKVIGRFVIN